MYSAAWGGRNGPLTHCIAFYFSKNNWSEIVLGRVDGPRGSARARDLVEIVLAKFSRWLRAGRPGPFYGLFE